MPTGDWRTVDFFLRNVSPFTQVKTAKQFPLRALDVGVGGGRWGFLFRDTMEWRADRYQKSEWAYTVDGVEVHAPYRNPVWDYAYNSIVIGKIQDQIARIEKAPPYNFVFFMDVIEHLPKAEGQSVLRRLLCRTKNRLLLTFPDGNDAAAALKQGAVHGNEHERHISLWTEKDLEQYEIIDMVRPCCYALKGMA